jgi:hypothetical protein
MFGLLVSGLGLLFGLVIYKRLQNMPVHSSMLEISELIYETCKTYLFTQGKFLLILEAFIGAAIIFYFGFLERLGVGSVLTILVFSLIGIAGSYSVAWFGIRVNTFANSRTAFASLRGKPYPCYDIPLQAGMSIGMLLISVELLLMLCILLFMPRELAGKCFIGFAIGESLGAAALRVRRRHFHEDRDIGADLMKIVFKIKEDDARNPGVIADCTGDNAGDSVGPSADGFETYGVTGVGFDRLYRSRRARCSRAGAAAGLDLCDAHCNGDCICTQLLHQRRDSEGKVPQRRKVRLRKAAYRAGMAHFSGLCRDHLCRFLDADSGPRGRFLPVVETFHGDHVRHAGGRDYSGNW